MISTTEIVLRVIKKMSLNIRKVFHGVCESCYRVYKVSANQEQGGPLCYLLKDITDGPHK